MIFQLFDFFAKTGAQCSKGNFLGIIPSWYHYLNFDDACNVVIDFKGHPADFWLIGLGIIDILLRVAGMVAVGFVIAGGFRFVLSQGEPENVKHARNSIINALIGVAIAVTASAIVAFVGAQFTSTPTGAPAAGGLDTTSLPNVDASNGSAINTTLQIVFGVLGGIAVLIIIIAGIKLLTSRGDPQAVGRARDTIIYAAIGLAVALTAFSIVTFVVTKL